MDTIGDADECEDNQHECKRNEVDQYFNFDHVLNMTDVDEGLLKGRTVKSTGG